VEDVLINREERSPTLSGKREGWEKNRSAAGRIGKARRGRTKARRGKSTLTLEKKKGLTKGVTRVCV